MKAVNEIFSDSKIDWTNFTISFELGGYAPNRSDFDFFAPELLAIAREDFTEKTNRGKINAISNVKRSIDNKIDMVLSIFDIDISNSTTKKTINEFLKNFNRSDQSNIKLDLINALGFAPSSIVGKTRSIRNSLEHKYKLPDEQSIKDGIEIASLFNDALEGKIKIVEANMVISNYEHMGSKINISFDVWNRVFKVSKVEPIKSKVIEIDPNKPSKALKIGSSDLMYYYLIRLSNYKDSPEELRTTVSLILKVIGNTMPKEHIQFSVSSVPKIF